MTLDINDLRRAWDFFGEQATTYAFVIHPDVHADFVAANAKFKYKYARWRERYKRRYGYDPDVQGEVGTL